MAAADSLPFVECYRRALDALKREPFTLLVLALLWTAVQAPGVLEAATGAERVFGGPLTGAPRPGLLAPLVSILVGGPLMVGLWHASLRAVRRQPVRLWDGLAGFRRYGQAVLCVLAFRVLVAVGVLFCVLPGLFLFGRLAAAPFLVGEREIRPLEALSASWSATRHRWPTALWIGLSWIPLGALGLLLCGVGIVPAAALGFAALAAWYDGPVPETLPTGPGGPAPGPAHVP